MAREFSRLDRIGEQMQRDLAQIIQREIKDPRLGMITVSRVKVSKDLSYADVYVTVLNTSDMDDPSSAKASVSVLNQASGFLRSELSRAIKLRVMPQLRFHNDETLGRAQRLDTLIQKARQKDGASSGGQSSNSVDDLDHPVSD